MKLESIRTILVINHQGIGDIVLSIPIYLSLREKYPGAKIYSTVKGFSESTILTFAGLSDKFIFTEVLSSGFFEKFKFLLKIFQYKFDLVVVPAGQNIRNALIISWLTRSRYSLSFYKNNFQKFLITTPISFPLNINRVFRNQIISAQILNRDCCKLLPLLFPYSQSTPSDHNSKFKMLNSRYIVVHPGSGELEKHKRFNLHHLSNLIKLIISSYDLQIVIVGSPQEKSLSESLISMVLSSNLVSLVGKTSLVEAMGVVSKSIMLISGDSSFMHIAAAFKVPTFTFFGPTSSEELAPTWAPHFTYSLKMPCSPCYPYLLTGCGNTICMDNVKIDSLFMSFSNFFNTINLQNE
ncbi:glycosyltransferase family 9 protein [Polynucleobacter sp. HIN7]|uniref:glycosyltransferase family 9 protein n=1 Tax=Polynucleobacter sp. HIN7 TaxID=3047866 RepID=UPI00257341A1|nr:glycosyltransferase family 9 protein [Polynucleobacter sp. HIN7]